MPFARRAADGTVLSTGFHMGVMSQMNAFGQFVGIFLPYLTLAVLVLGLVYRIWKWQRAGVANLALYPSASTKGQLFRKVLGEVLLFSSFRKENRALWSRTWIFHLALVIIILGHTRLITDWPLRVLLGLPEATVNRLSSWGGGLFGIVAMLTCLLLLVRRFTIKRVREISDGMDYSILVLLLLILGTGNYMRFFAHFDIGVAQAYFATLFSLQATRVPDNTMFIAHLFLVQVLLIYLPFGKLLHIPGVFYSKTLMAKDY